MRSKNLLLGLCVLMVFSLVLGCQRSSTSSVASSNSASIVTRPGQLPIVSQPITLTLGVRQSVNVNNYETNYLTGWLGERTGIKMAFHMFSSVASDSNTQFELMISAGEKLPDVMLFAPGSSGDWMVQGDNGVFIDLNPYFRDWAYFYNQRIASVSASEAIRIELLTTAISGKRYAYPSYSQQINMPYGSMNWINKTWLDRLGLPIPKTTEEFFNTMIAFRDRNPTGTGAATIPFAGSLSVSNGDPLFSIINSFVYHPWRGHNNFYLNVTDGKLWTPWTTEEYREALRYLNRMYREGLLHQSTFTNTTQELGVILSYKSGEAGRVGFTSGNPTLIFFPETPAIFDFTVQPPLVGPKGVSYYPKIPNSVSASTFITKDCAYPEAAFRWLDFMSEKETTMIARMGELNLDWRWTRPEERAMSVFNTPAQIEVINTLWSTPQNTHWQQVPGGFYIEGENSVQTFWKNDGSFTNLRFAMYHNLLESYDGKDVTEQVESILYSQDELSTIRETRASINTYREESLALFITGQLSLDRDWNTYLATLDRIGLQRYLEIAQSAYTRTMALVGK